MSKPYHPTKIDNYPGTSRPIPGGLTLYNINVTYFKNHLAEKLQINPTAPERGACTARRRRITPGRCAQNTRMTGGSGNARGQGKPLLGTLASIGWRPEIVGIKFWKKEDEKEKETTEAQNGEERGKRIKTKGWRW